MKRANQRGATATLLAGSMLLLLGVAAVVIDIGLGYNERNQDQIAADNAVMAGAVDKADFLSNQVISASVLQFAQPNLRNIYGGPNDPAWVELWRSCSDSGNPGWSALPEPAAWAGVSTPTPPQAGNKLDCISQTSSLLRVRIPDQLTSTTFGKVLGAQNLTTNAVAIAKAELNTPVPPMVPFGISGSAGPGELCFSTSGSGTADPPCSGPSAGTFGTILSELFGDFYGTPNCGNPTSTNSIEINIAVGVDHLLDVWSNPTGTVALGSPHPGDNTVLNSLPDTNRDACDLDPNGFAVPVDGIPLNTVQVDSGFASGVIQNGLVSNNTYFGKKSRLQQWASVGNPSRTVVAKRGGGPTLNWVLDNRGPWAYLNDSSDIAWDPGGLCRKASYTATPALPTTGVGSKQEKFNQCIALYTSSSINQVIFEPSIATSPRFVWAPQYWYRLPTTGLSWEPVYKFRMAFIGGVWFKGGPPTGMISFYPDEEFNDSTGPELCLPSGGGSNCHQLSLWQMSAWYLPDNAVPASVQNALPGPTNPRVAALWQ